MKLTAKGTTASIFHSRVRSQCTTRLIKTYIIIYRWKSVIYKYALQQSSCPLRIPSIIPCVYVIFINKIATFSLPAYQSPITPAPCSRFSRLPPFPIRWKILPGFVLAFHFLRDFVLSVCERKRKGNNAPLTELSRGGEILIGILEFTRRKGENNNSISEECRKIINLIEAINREYILSGSRGLRVKISRSILIATLKLPTSVRGRIDKS